MNKIIRLSLKKNPYNIYVGGGLLRRLPHLVGRTKIGRDAVVVTTQAVRTLYGKQLDETLKKFCRSVLWLVVPDSEKSKNAQLALRLIGQIMAFDKNKSLFLVAFGGGVVGDLTGFMAAIYKRGIPYLQIPTTLLAQIDSSIGGKTAIDTAFGKNLIGAFYQPRFVLCDINLLGSLPKEQILAGLSEAVKYAVIGDPELFDFLQKNRLSILAKKTATLARVVWTCAGIKAKVVARDEFDQKGIRIILNFGHTFGHALEAASNFKISHGQGVSIGMVCATRLSEKCGLINPKEAAKIVRLIEAFGLKTKAKGIRQAPVLRALAYDKKCLKGRNRFVLIQKIGKTKILESIPQALIRKVLTQHLA
ncbi:MAG: 3-dehydroquinate synthase [Candidatus Omnitrophota bacterium]